MWIVQQDENYWRDKRHSARTDLWSGGGRGFRTWMTAGLSETARSRLRRGFAGLIGFGLVASVFAILLLLANAPGPCTAFETALLRRARHDVFGAKHQARWLEPLADRERQSASNGIIGARTASLEYSWLPSVIACTALSWQVRIHG